MLVDVNRASVGELMALPGIGAVRAEAIVLDRIRTMLETHPAVDPKSIRVRFIRLGAFSLDVEGVAYLYARDWDHFPELQEQLLFGITEIVERAGTGIAFPS